MSLAIRTLTGVLDAAQRRNRVAPRAMARGRSSMPPPPRDASFDAENYLASLLDLRASVDLASALGKPALPADDRVDTDEQREIGAKTASTVIDSLRVLANAAMMARLADTVRARAMTVGSLLGTMRGAGLLEAPMPADAARAARSLWGPLGTHLSQQLVTFDREMEDRIASIASVAPPSARSLFAMHAHFERLVRPTAARLLSASIDQIEAALADALLVHARTLPSPCGEREVAPLLEPDGAFPNAMSLGDALLSAWARHRMRAAVALVEACRGTPI